MEDTIPLKRKVLVVAYYFPPMALSGVQRVSKFVKYLPDHGYEPTVLTVEPKGYFAFDEGLEKELQESQIRVVRTKSFDPTRLFRSKKKVSMPKSGTRSFVSWISSLFFIPDNKIGWRRHAVKQGKELLDSGDFDLIFSSAPPYTSHLIGAELSKYANIPLICDFRDDWVGNPRHRYPTSWHKSKHVEMENRILRWSHFSIAINRQIMEGLVGRNLGPSGFHKVKVIPQGFDPSDFNQDAMPRLNPKMVITYTGIFYHAQSPDTFFKALGLTLKTRPDIREQLEARFVGHLSEAARKSIKQQALTENISYEGYLDHDDTIRHLLGSDILWMVVGKQKGGSSISTGKLFEYFGSRKPILGLVPDGAAKDALKLYGASKIVDPDDVTAISTAIIEYFDEWKSGSLRAPNEDFVLKHRRDHLSGELARVFSSTLVSDHVYL